MKIELKKIKHAEYLSEETNAYSAQLWVNGKHMADVSNDGNGGCDRCYPRAPFTQADINAVEAYAKALPKRKAFGMEFEQSLESICGDRFQEWILAKEVNRIRKRFASKVVFKHDGKIREIGLKSVKKLCDKSYSRLNNHVLSNYPNVTILNTMNDAEILAVLQ